MTREIRRMIATATVGDGDQVLNILEKLCDALDAIAKRNEVRAKGITNGDTIEPLPSESK